MARIVPRAVFLDCRMARCTPISFQRGSPGKVLLYDFPSETSRRNTRRRASRISPLQNVLPLSTRRLCPTFSDSFHHERMPVSGARGTRSSTGIALPTYHGHNRLSYYPFDVPELVELRAHQRTFDNAYLRTILATLAYGILVLKVFDERFYTGR